MKRFKNILCVIETVETCKPALERAVTLAETNQADLMVVKVVERVDESSNTKEMDSTHADLAECTGERWWTSPGNLGRSLPHTGCNPN